LGSASLGRRLPIVEAVMPSAERREGPKINWTPTAEG
jgi:hypothetical protein